MLINDVGDFGFKNDDTRIQIKGTNTLGRDLGAHTVAPKCFSALFLFFSFLVMFLCILVMPFVRFRMRSYRFEGPSINLHEEEPEFERQNARMTKNGVETQLLGLGRNCICARVLFCTFPFQVRIFLSEDDMDARSILITSSG